MKTPDSKAKSTALQRSESPFFHRRSEHSFFGATGAQAKLSVNEPGDRFEQEADAMAEQVAAPEKDALQTKPLGPISRKVQRQEDDTLHRSGEGESGEVSPKTERKLDESKGGGSPLPTPVREDMESKFGTELDHVRVHTDTRAEEMNQDVGARAFTHGRDIYFNANEYNPATREGKKLLAHELTHTVQQAEGSVQAKRIQREDADQRPDTFDGKKGKVERVSGSSYKLTIPELKVPKIKKDKGFIKEPLTFKHPSGREDTQRTIWDNHMKSVTGIDAKIQDKITKSGSPPLTKGKPGEPTSYGFKLAKSGGGANTSYIIGTIANMRQRIARPYWNPQGVVTMYDVDHQLEMQLGGKNQLDNLWLWEASANRSSGSVIDKEKDRTIDALLAEASGADAKQIWKRKPDPSRGGTYEVTYSKLGQIGIAGQPNLYYTQDDIEKDLKPLDGLTPLTQAEIDKMGFGREDQLLLFANPAGGRSYKFDNWDPAQPSRTISTPFGKSTKATNITFNKGTGGSINVGFFQGNKHLYATEKTLPIHPMEGIPMAGYIPGGRDLINNLTGFQAKAFSPIEYTDASIMPGEGLVARAKILPDVPFLKDASLDLVIEGDDVYIEKRFTGGEIKLPPPFTIYSSSLAISAGTNGLKVAGGVNFGIERVGEGNGEGFVGSDGKFGIKGDFTFDKKLFDNATVSIEYQNSELTVSGTIQIPKGKVKGIKTASATVTYSAGTLTASGNAELDIKGLQNGTMNLRYSGTELEVGGSFQLSSDIPRIKGGSVAVNVKKTGEEYEVSASGNVQPDIPGITSTIAVSYVDGALTIEGSVEYEKGIAKGRVRMGATNRPMDENGNPTGGKPGDKWTVYGEGNLTLKLTPWLQAGAGVKFLPSGDMEVSGTIGIPGTVNVFDRKEINKRLFTFPTLEIPLFAIPLGPRSLGIVATIGGGIDFNAGFGPGKLEALSATINYKPGQEDSITLNGHGKFVIPADATLRFFGRAGIGLSIGIAGVSGNIELGGAVGIQGAAEAEVDVNWSKSAGITLDATGRIFVEPVLKFDLKLVLEAHALFLSKEWSKTLAQKEFASGMRYGLEFPVHYEEGKPFDLSLDDIKVIRPEIDIGEAMRRFGRELI